MAFTEHNSGTSMSAIRKHKNKEYNILWYFTIQYNTKIEARRSDIIVTDKTKMEVKVVDVTIPGDQRVNERKVGKIEKYKVFKDGITRMWSMKELIVIPVVVGALGAISTGFRKYIAAIGIEMRVEHAQKTTKIPFYWRQQRFSNWYLDAKKKHNYKYHCARLCETSDNRYCPLEQPKKV